MGSHPNARALESPKVVLARGSHAGPLYSVLDLSVGTWGRWCITIKGL